MTRTQSRLTLVPSQTVITEPFIQGPIAIECLKDVFLKGRVILALYLSIQHQWNLHKYKVNQGKWRSRDTEHHNIFPFSYSKHLNIFPSQRQPVRDGLKVLEDLGLISLDISSGRSPRVTITREIKRGSGKK